MGFYGNITDAARTQFQFDIIYASRKEMDQHATDDGVYMGRFVLVNYENQYSEPLSQEEETFYEGQEPSLYTINFNRDKKIYGTDRGYDSTVWQKVYTNNAEKYIMIAELNTITPTFEIGDADAPRMVPLTPHFGEDSTNIYYKLHWSPTWGLRVKAANPELQGNVLTSEGFSESQLTSMSTDSHQYLSDEETKWYKTVNNNGQTSDYVFVATGNPDIGAWDNATNADNRQGIPAAIYYNKDGFNPAVSSYGYRELTNTDTYAINRFYKKVDGQYVLSSDPAMIPGTTYYEKIENHIKVEPSGKSGHLYNQEDNDPQTPGLTPQVDTQEISIMLPGIGDAIAAVWDLIYGSEEINGSVNRNLDIGWESGRDVIPRRGLRLITDFEVNDNEVDDTEGHYRYQTKNVETIAGAINSVHDLMGMIIVPSIPDDYSLLNENKIYYDENTGTFNRKKLYYHYSTIDDNNLDIYNYEEVAIDENNYEPNLYFFKNNQNKYEPAVGDYINQQYYIRTLIPDGEYTAVPDYSSYIDFNGANYAYADYFGINGFYDYIRNSKYDNSKKYYTWDSVVDAMEKHDVSGKYASNQYYIRDAIGNFVLDTNLTPQNTMHYRLVPSNIQTLSQINTDYDGIYMPNTYAFKITEGDNSYFAIDSSPEMTSGRQYYRLQVSPRTDTESIYIKVKHFVEVTLTKDTYVANTYYTYNTTSKEYILCTNPLFDKNEKYYYETMVYQKVDNKTEQFTVDTTQTLTLLQFHNHEFYRKNGNNYMVITPSSDIDFSQASQIYALRKDTIRNEGESNGGTYILNDVDFSNENESAMIKITNDFYQANRYYYEANNGEYTSFILDTHTTNLSNTDYYVVDPTKLVVADDLTNVFEPNKYYIKKADNIYELVTTATNPQEQFYTRNDLCYVIDDTKHIFKHGALWNYGIHYVPASITLATRTESYGLEPLEGFARDITTMHGLILKIKALLNDGDEDTRDTSTVQGVLNALNDKLAQLDNWKSGQVFIIDDYGRLHGAEIKGVNGMTVKVDSNPENPSVKFGLNWDPNNEDADPEQGIDVGEIKLGNYSLNEQNTGAIQTGDTLKKALNKLENKAIDADSPIKYAGEESQPLAENIQQFWQNFDNEWKRTEPLQWATGTTAGIQYIEIEPINDAGFAQFTRVSTDGEEYVELDGTISDTVFSTLKSLVSVPKFYTYITDSGYIEISSPQDMQNGYYVYWQDLLNSNVFRFYGTEIYDTTKNLAFNIIKVVRPFPITEGTNRYAKNTYYTLINNSYFKLDADGFNPNKIYYQLQLPIYSESTLETFTLRELYDNKLSANQNFEYEVKSEETLDQNAQAYWENYITQVNTLKSGYRTITFSYYEKVNDLTVSQFQANIGTYYYDSIFPLKSNSPSGGGQGGSGSSINLDYEGYMQRYIEATTFNENYQYYQKVSSKVADKMIAYNTAITKEGFLKLCVQDISTIQGMITPLRSGDQLRALYYILGGYVYTYDANRQNYPYQRLFESLNNVDYFENIIANYGGQIYTYGVQYLKKYSNVSLFTDDIHNTTHQYVFKPVELTSNTYSKNKYYLQNSNILDTIFYYPSTDSTFDSEVTYYELQEFPIITQEREVMDTSLLHICDLLYGVGSIYNTSTNVGIETETDSGIYKLPNMPGEWRLLHKAFKYYSYAIEGNDNEYGIVWDDTTTQDGSENSLRRVNIIRNQSGIEIRLRWYNKITYYDKDADQHIVTIPLSLLGLNSGWNQYIYCESDGTASICMLQASFTTGVSLDYFVQETLYNNIDRNQHTNTGSAFLNNTIIIPDEKQMLDGACDQFTWERIS